MLFLQREELEKSGGASQSYPLVGNKRVREGLAIRPAINFAASVIDVAAQLAAFFFVHLSALIPLRFEAFVTIAALRPVAVQILLLAKTITIPPLILTMYAVIALGQHEAA
jgi:hypothetical protein